MWLLILILIILIIIIINLSNSKEKLEQELLKKAKNLDSEKTEKEELSDYNKKLNCENNKKINDLKLKIENLENKEKQSSLIINEQNNEIECLKSKTESLEKLEKQLLTIIDEKSDEVEKLKLEKNNLSEELAFYTGIKKDSMNLNISNDIESDYSESIKPLLETIDLDSLNDEKKEIYNLMENTNNNLLITGKAGTGKSYLLKTFKSHTKKRVLYTAPTGISALNINGVTIHSAFRYNNLLEGNPINLSDNDRALLRNIDTLVIDEVSMVRVDTLNRINEILQDVNKNKFPFGKKQVILFGDLFQLPPVAKSQEVAYFTDKYGGIYFFNSPSFQQGSFIFKELSEIFRQKDIEFISILNNVREGTVTDKDIETLNRHYTKKLPRRVVQVVPTKAMAYEINTENLKKINAKEYVYKAHVSNPNVKETEFPCDFELKLKVGALVMMLTNDIQYKRWVNGTVGIVSSLDENMVKVTINGTEYEISPHDFEKRKCEYDKESKNLTYVVEDSVKQFPIILAYAITIHKSQGMTYQQIGVNLENCFATGQAYVALSRCSNFEKLYLTELVKKSHISVDNTVKNFYKEIKNKSIKNS